MNKSDPNGCLYDEEDNDYSDEDHSEYAYDTTYDDSEGEYDEDFD